jgi:signal transduction histidine kinase
VAVYYVVSEALTNVAKHAHASRVEIDLEAAESVIRVAVIDDGVGSANTERGSGLIGLRDRIESLGGSIEIRSPERAGTRLDIEVPLTQP